MATTPIKKKKPPTAPPTMGAMLIVRLCEANVGIAVGVELIENTTPDILGVCTVVLVSVACVEGDCGCVVVDWEMVLIGVVAIRLDELEQLA